jgi:hypothetical protein
MNKTIKLEEAAMFGFSIYLFYQTNFDWWWYLALILIPDIGMLGYIVGNKVGAITYNLFHHKAIAIVMLCLGWYLSNEWIELTGIILFGHSSMDRIMGYGLKYSDSFHHTHLGWLKQDKNKTS